MKKIETPLMHLRAQLIQHPLYAEITTLEDIQCFMEQHVFAVWDFMSLVKKLQSDLTCTATPWIPATHSQAGRLINEIVWGEETDLNKDGKPMSHFEMYLQAMEEAGASTIEIKAFLNKIRQGTAVFDAIEQFTLPQHLKDFLNFTFQTIAENKTHVIAAVFTFGREDLIPDMFIEMVKTLKNEEVSLHHLIYYLERHIEIDGDEHGPMALQMIEDLCQGDNRKIEEATNAAATALKMRIALWDGVLKSLKPATIT